MEEMNKFSHINDIKSFNIIKKIFYLVIINKKLDIIIYNKQLQKKFGINIEQYKQICKKSKIY